MSVSITTRKTKSGRRFVVRFRLGGRSYPIEHGGSFKTLREARARRDLIAGELANGRNPRDLLQAMTAAPSTARSFTRWAEAYKASRVDVSDATRANTETHLKTLLPVFGERDPQAISFADVQEWVSGAELAPGSLRPYIATLRLVLDYADVEPNPARDKRVKLPELELDEINPPTTKQFLAVLERLSTRWVLPLVTLEQTGCRSSELASLAWGDVDVAENRFRLRAARTKTRRARWVQVPEWLMTEIAATCPLEDRTAERKVFGDYTRGAARNAVARACVVAEVPHFHPHDLRHRRISVWHQQGVPVKTISERVGHARASMTLDTYSHVMPLEEVSANEFTALLRLEGRGSGL
jgi:integrase